MGFEPTAPGLGCRGRLSAPGRADLPRHRRDVDDPPAALDKDFSAVEPRGVEELSPAGLGAVNICGKEDSGHCLFVSRP